MNILRAKVAIVGNQQVGKSAIVGQLIRQYFNNTYQTTLGVEYNTYEVEIKDTNYKVQLHILDITGFSAFREMVLSQAKDANFVLYVYDATNLESFQAIRLWYESLRQNLVNKKCVQYLLGNKIDLESKIAVDESSINNMLKLYNFKGFSISALLNKNLVELFQDIAHAYYDNYMSFTKTLTK